MPAYRYLVGDLAPASGNGLREEIPFSDVKYGDVLNRPGGFSATIPLRHPKATRANLDPGRTAIHVERDGNLRWSGILWAAQASVEAGTLSVAGQGWWSYFRGADGQRGRLLRITKTYTAVDQLAIARDLVNYAQAQAGGNLGIIVGAETGGTLRDQTWYHYERKNIGTTIEQLAARQGGFDFAIETGYDAGGIIRKTFTLYQPRRGRVTPLIWELGVNLEGLAVGVDATKAANQLDALGNGEGDSMLIATVSDPSQLASYPLLEDVVALKDVSVPATLQGQAALRLAGEAEPVVSVGPLLARQANPDTALGTFITGDSVKVRGQDGWINVDELMRIQAIEVSVDKDGYEKVGVTLAQEEASFLS